MLDLVQVHKLLEGEAFLLPIIGEATQLEIKLSVHIRDILQTQKEFLEDK